MFPKYKYHVFLSASLRFFSFSLGFLLFVFSSQIRNLWLLLADLKIHSVPNLFSYVSTTFYKVMKRSLIVLWTVPPFLGFPPYFFWMFISLLWLHYSLRLLFCQVLFKNIFKFFFIFPQLCKLYRIIQTILKYLPAVMRINSIVDWIFLNLPAAIQSHTSTLHYSESESLQKEPWFYSPCLEPKPYILKLSFRLLNVASFSFNYFQFKRIFFKSSTLFAIFVAPASSNSSRLPYPYRTPTLSIPIACAPFTS